MRPLLALTLALATAGTAPAQVGSLLPDFRLPVITAEPRHLQWEEAGYFQHLPDGVIRYTQVVDVTAFGAVGDGTTNNDAAFQQALAKAAEHSAAGFSILHVPAGTYALARTISLPSNCVLKGDGATSTTLAFSLPTGNYVIAKDKTNVGVEDLRIERNDANDEAGFTGNLISFTNIDRGYVRGVNTYRPRRNHLRVVNCQFVEVRDCFFDDAQDVGGGGNGYGAELDQGSRWCLVENNVFRGLRHSMILQTDCHFNVYGYNFSTEPIRTEIPRDWASDITLHGSYDANRGGPYSNLFEGNRCNFISPDNSHGPNGDYNLFYRNEASYLGLYIDGQTRNQTMVNNYFSCAIFFWITYGYPYVAADTGGHFGVNNRVVKIRPEGTTTTIEDIEDARYAAEFSYYLEAKPAFLGNSPWPIDPVTDTIPAETRGFTTIDAGWSGYVQAPPPVSSFSIVGPAAGAAVLGAK